MKKILILLCIFVFLTGISTSATANLIDNGDAGTTGSATDPIPEWSEHTQDIVVNPDPGHLIGIVPEPGVSDNNIFSFAEGKFSLSDPADPGDPWANMMKQSGTDSWALDTQFYLSSDFITDGFDKFQAKLTIWWGLAGIPHDHFFTWSTPELSSASQTEWDTFSLETDWSMVDKDDPKNPIGDLDRINKWVVELYGIPSDNDDMIGLYVDNVVLADAHLPEPATLLLLGTGLIGLARIRRKLQ